MKEQIWLECNYFKLYKFISLNFDNSLLLSFKINYQSRILFSCFRYVSTVNTKTFQKKMLEK